MPSPIRTLVSPRAVESARAAAERHEHETALHRLEATAPFSRLEAATQRRCVRGIRRVDFARGEHLPGRGEPGASLHLIHSGEVAVHRRSTRTVATLGSGELVGRRLLSADDECTARTDVALYEFDDRVLEEILGAEPELEAGLSAIAATREATLAGSENSAIPTHDQRDAEFSLVPRIRRLLGQR
jgi:CRP-like cAMP-binding protein